MRLQPIRVYCFHQVSEKFDSTTMWECDWTQIYQFKQNILYLKSKYNFISLAEAYHKLTHDKLRCKKYAVLTADDGWASVKNIIPWLAEQSIPVTLFVNPCYLDGIHKQKRETEKLLTKDELVKLVSTYHPYVTIASHGYKHIDVRLLTKDEYIYNITKAEEELRDMPGKIPFYAFTYGHFYYQHLYALWEHKLIPVRLNGEWNYKYDGYIHRDFLDGKKIEELC